MAGALMRWDWNTNAGRADPPRRYVGGWTRAEIAHDIAATAGMVIPGHSATIGLELQNEPGSFIMPRRKDCIDTTAREVEDDRLRLGR